MYLVSVAHCSLINSLWSSPIFWHQVVVIIGSDCGLSCQHLAVSSTSDDLKCGGHSLASIKNYNEYAKDFCCKILYKMHFELYIFCPCQKGLTRVVLSWLQAPIQLFGTEGRYAHALYSAASKEKKLDAVEKELKAFQVRNIQIVITFCLPPV